MKVRIVRSVIFIAALLLVGSAWAQAQAPSVHIGFGFVAAGKMLNAGDYSFTVASDGKVTLTPEKGGAALELPRMKTLSNRNVQRTELVFDVSGSVKYLSEVWLPGKGGCLVGRADDTQEQVTVSGPKAKQ